MHMDDHKKSVAKECLDGAEGNTLTFPQIVGKLMQEGFEGYAIDFRRALATYYTPGGDSIEVPMHKVDVPVAPSFDAVRVQAAIKEAQQLVPGYTYLGFCNKSHQPAAQATSSRFRAAGRFTSGEPLRPTWSIFRIKARP
jgi:hypothetical protein